MNRIFCLLILAANFSRGAIVQVTFDGFLDADTEPVFGLLGSNLAFHGSLTIDTSIGAPVFIPSGTIDGYDVYASDFFGYSSEAIVALDLAFGSKTWEIAAIDYIKPSPSFGANIWFNTDLEGVPEPSFVWAYFADANSRFELGIAFAPPLQFGDTLCIVDSTDRPGTAYGSQLTVQRAFIPEPGSSLTFSILAISLGALILRRIDWFNR
ncbi:MAG: hypothetical protein IT577_20425 [Verrucomicrobiae bacterium]|nr:hypothetical protein [Verrucomicrobiae bacterium]